MDLMEGFCECEVLGISVGHAKSVRFTIFCVLPLVNV